MRNCFFCAAIGVLLPFAAFAFEFHVSVRVDLGKDVGQNFGTVFEAVDADGKPVLGAGYLGSYNTQARSDRRLLHFYVQTPAETFAPDPLPRLNDDAGTYLFEFNNRLFAKGRGGGKDNSLRVWDPVNRQWPVDESTIPLSIHVGNGILAATERRVTYNGAVVLELSPEQGFIAETYYANGFLVFRHRHPGLTPPLNNLVAFPWSAYEDAAGDVPDCPSVPMGTPGEFVYAYGQLDDEILAATNTGGVYVFDGNMWRVLLEPDVNTSFQIYAMLDFRDRLLMGQYPTGELFEYDGTALRRIPGWPPVMRGVSTSAREAQTLTMYGGDLYAGVWPWAEIWRLDSRSSEWTFAGRMFTHPEPTDETVHPYEEETIALGAVLNLWGQRVTSLVPLGESLYISTSSKGGNPWTPDVTFLADGKWKEYGMVYRHRKPGALAVHTVWKDGPIVFDFRVEDGRMRVLQDGVERGAAECTDEPVAAPVRVVWGNGLFGTFRGTLEPLAD